MLIGYCISNQEKNQNDEKLSPMKRIAMVSPTNNFRMARTEESRSKNLAIYASEQVTIKQIILNLHMDEHLKRTRRGLQRSRGQIRTKLIH